MPFEIQSQGLSALGHPALVAALGFAFLALVLSSLGAARTRPYLVEAGRRALTISWGFVALASGVLLWALFVNDFSLEYVTNYTSRSLSGPYTFGAFWGGMEGSLLFWTLLLTGFSALALRGARTRGAALGGWSGAVLAGIALFFLTLLVSPADPFTTLTPAPADGRGLNPLLQSPGMLIHPPLLYTGFVGFSIPFAFAMAALLAGRPDTTWFTATRRWTLFAWSALSIGIVLGGAWAYTELGWGGYWAWDPVENASFMPWLTATAYVHSVVIQEKRGMFKVWNVSLILLTYALAIFGTFLTRSGLLSSVHTFTEGPIGKWFLPFLALLLIGGLGIVAARLDHLRSENKLDATLSRESAFLANNVLFLAAAFAVLWGTIYPIVAELVSGVRLSVGPPFFNAVFIPLGLLLIVLTGLGPLLSWRRTSRTVLFKIVQPPLVAGLVTVLVVFLLGVRSTGASIALAACTFTAAAIVGEFARGSRSARRRGLGWLAALNETILRNRRRYGGYVVHLGVLLMVVGFAGGAWKVERQSLVEQGQSMQVRDYTLTYENLRQDENDEKQILEAEIVVERDGSRVTTLFPQRNLHKAQGQPQSEVAIKTSPIEDLYVVVTSFDQDGAAALRAFVNPLTWWIWAGAAVMLGGMLLVLADPKAARLAATVPAPSSQVRERRDPAPAGAGRS